MLFSTIVVETGLKSLQSLDYRRCTGWAVGRAPKTYVKCSENNEKKRNKTPSSLNNEKKRNSFLSFPVNNYNFQILFQSKFIISFNLPLICFKFFGARLTAHPAFCSSSLPAQICLSA